MATTRRRSQRLRMLVWVGVGPGSLGLDRVFQLVANVACCSCWCSFCSAGGRDVMAYHPALLLHAVGAGAALAGSTVAIISSAPRRCYLVGLQAVFSMPRARCACNPRAALHISSPHDSERMGPECVWDGVWGLWRGAQLTGFCTVCARLRSSCDCLWCIFVIYVIEVPKSRRGSSREVG